MMEKRRALEKRVGALTMKSQYIEGMEEGSGFVVMRRSTGELRRKGEALEPQIPRETIPERARPCTQGELMDKKRSGRDESRKEKRLLGVLRDRYKRGSGDQAIQ